MSYWPPRPKPPAFRSFFLSFPSTIVALRIYSCPQLSAILDSPQSHAVASSRRGFHSPMIPDFFCLTHTPYELKRDNLSVAAYCCFPFLHGSSPRRLAPFGAAALKSLPSPRFPPILLLNVLFPSVPQNYILESLIARLNLLSHFFPWCPDDGWGWVSNPLPSLVLFSFGPCPQEGVGFSYLCSLTPASKNPHFEEHWRVLVVLVLSGGVAHPP